MKKYLLFENVGHVDPRGLFMIGASPKRDDETKIGRFGSGFKYSIAKILRDNLDIKVFSGETEIPISKTPFELEGKQFYAININGRETSLTTGMGPDWQWWQILRELWCNALDAGEADVRKDCEDCQGRHCYTRVYVELNDEIRQVLEDWDSYFTHDRDDAMIVHDEFKVYRPSNGKCVLYRKGIRCHSSELSALFHYDYYDYSINEERVITSEWEAGYKTGRMLGKYASVEVAAEILRNACRENTFEKSIDWDYATLNDNWRDAARSFDSIALDGSAGHYMDKLGKTDNYALVTKTLAKKLLQLDIKILGMTPDGRKKEWYDVEHLTPKQEFLLKATIENLEKDLGYKVNYPVKVVEFSEAHTLCKANVETKEILFSPKMFDQGKRYMALMIMHEQETIYNKLDEKASSMHAHLLNMWMGTLEEKSGFFF